MAIQRKLSDDELALVEIMTDPVWCGEFLRSTGDLSFPDNARDFAYRWYQRDLLTDTSTHISLCGGRAIGKCSPASARIYTYPYGYMSIRRLVVNAGLNKADYFVVYALDHKTKQLVQRKAKITYNGKEPVYRITTSSGHVFEGTDNHPVLTLSGYVPMNELQTGEHVAVATYLPHESEQRMFNWYELRMMGYYFGMRYPWAHNKLSVKYRKQLAELHQIAKFIDARLVKNNDGTYTLMRKKGPMKHYLYKFMNEMHVTHYRKTGVYSLHKYMKSECLEHNKIFLEALFSMYAEFTPITVKLKHAFHKFILDVQEFLLRFGIESKVTKTDSYSELELLDYNAYYNFFTKLDIPGVKVVDLKPPTYQDTESSLRYEQIAEKESIGSVETYAVQVEGLHNYISDNIYVHNSVVLEDRLVFEAMNAEQEFPDTREQVLSTANAAQMTPLLDHFIMRFNSPVLRGFLEKVNRSSGTIDFNIRDGVNYRMFTRIAGSRGETNVVGLHTPRIKVDEAQLYPIKAFIELGPKCWATY